jgi:hypothetical protein
VLGDLAGQSCVVRPDLLVGILAAKILDHHPGGAAGGISGVVQGLGDRLADPVDLFTEACDDRGRFGGEVDHHQGSALAIWSAYMTFRASISARPPSMSP